MTRSPLEATLPVLLEKSLAAGWRVALLTSDIRLARRTGLPLRVLFTTRHGGLTVIRFQRKEL